MICPKCTNEGVKNQVLGKEFYYCRTCKDEIPIDSPETVVWGELARYNLEFDQQRHQWIYSCGTCGREDGKKHRADCSRPAKVTKRLGTTVFSNGGSVNWNLSSVHPFYGDEEDADESP